MPPKKRSTVTPIKDPTLFEMGKLEEAGTLANLLNVVRPYSEPGLFLGTSAFTANGWPGSFYPPGMESTDYLTHYATQFQTVEIDSTYYRTPSASTVTGWFEKTPPDFVFAAKVPQIITHEKILVNCEAEFEEFVDRMDILDEKLGPLLFQIPKFTKYQIQPDEFSRRLASSAVGCELMSLSRRRRDFAVARPRRNSGARVSSTRNFCRARNNLAFRVPIRRPRIPAVSLTVRSSSWRQTTVRNFACNWLIASQRMCSFSSCSYISAGFSLLSGISGGNRSADSDFTSSREIAPRVRFLRRHIRPSLITILVNQVEKDDFAWKLSRCINAL
jgi:Protein of unknown function DUF72